MLVNVLNLLITVQLYHWKECEIYPPCCPGISRLALHSDVADCCLCMMPTEINFYCFGISFWTSYWRSYEERLAHHAWANIRSYLYPQLPHVLILTLIWQQNLPILISTVRRLQIQLAIVRYSKSVLRAILRIRLIDQSGTYDRGWVVHLCISKRWEARSRLYQRRFLQHNLIENKYFSRSEKIYTHLHRFQLKHLANVWSTFF